MTDDALAHTKDTVLKRRVALKVPDLGAPADDLDVRLLREARILASLEDPGIVPVHDAGTLADGRAFGCMNYVEGQILARHIATLNLPDKLRLLERIAESLDFLVVSVDLWVRPFVKEGTRSVDQGAARNRYCARSIWEVIWKGHQNSKAVRVSSREDRGCFS